MNHWKYVVAGFVLAMALVAIIFALPLKTITLERAETYYEAELKFEEYEVEEPYTVQETVIKSEVVANGFFKVLPLGIVIPFTIEKPDTRLTGYYENPILGRFAITGIGDRIIWEIMGNRNEVDLILQEGNYNAVFREDAMWGEDCFIFLKLEWSSIEEVAKFRTITKYKETPVQIEKQRIIEEKYRISLWRYVFKGT